MTDKFLVPSSETNPVTVGEIFSASGYFSDARQAAQAIVKIMAGRSLGLSDVAAMTGIDLIKGKLSLQSVTMAAILKSKDKYNYRVREINNEVCRIEFFENDESIGTSEFTIDDAKTAGLFARNTNYRLYPRNMLFSRAMSNGIKWFCPDAIGCPAYTPGELDFGSHKQDDGIIIEQIDPTDAFVENLREYDEVKVLVAELIEEGKHAHEIIPIISGQYNGYDAGQIFKIVEEMKNA